MTTVIFANKNVEKKMQINCATEKVIEAANKFVPSIETQLHTSVDFIVKDNEVTFLCDGVSTMLFEFIQQICNYELAKIK